MTVAQTFCEFFSVDPCFFLEPSVVLAPVAQGVTPSPLRRGLSVATNEFFQIQLRWQSALVRGVNPRVIPATLGPFSGSPWTEMTG